jgi:hypothetical protein
MSLSTGRGVRFRDGEAERLGGREVDEEYEFGWKLDRQVARFGATEDAIRVGSSVPKVRSVLEQAALLWWGRSQRPCRQYARAVHQPNGGIAAVVACRPCGRR